MSRIVVNNRQDVTRLALFVTLGSLCIVTLGLIALFPRSEWLRQITVIWPLFTLISYTATRHIGIQFLEINMLNEELQRLLNRDRLTDVATRDCFFSRLAEVPDEHGVALMVDIDHFKQVNDTYGHLAGDRVITHVAHILRQATRPDDIVCRFGGEEFLIYLNRANLESAGEAAERIRHCIANTVVQSEYGDIAVTASIGASLSMSSEEINEAIRQADEALYRAKGAGRNRVVMSVISDLKGEGSSSAAGGRAA